MLRLLLVIAASLAALTGCKSNDEKKVASNDTDTGSGGDDSAEILVEMGLTGSEFLAEASSAFKGIGGADCAAALPSASSTYPVESANVALPAQATFEMRCLVDTLSQLLALVSADGGPIASRRKALAVGDTVFVDLEPTSSDEPKYVRLKRSADTEAYPYEIGFLTLDPAGTSAALKTTISLKDLGSEDHDSMAKVVNYVATTSGFQIVSLDFDTREREMNTRVQYGDSTGAITAQQDLPWLQSLGLSWLSDDSLGSSLKLGAVWNRTASANSTLGPNYYSHRVAAGDVSLARAAYSPVGGYTVQHLAHIPAASLSSVTLTTSTGATSAFDSYSYEKNMKYFVLNEVISQASAYAGCSTFGNVLNALLSNSALPTSVCGASDAVLATVWTSLKSACLSSAVSGTVQYGVNQSATVNFCAYVNRAEYVQNPQFVKRGSSDLTVEAATQTLVDQHAEALTTLAGLSFSDEEIALLKPDVKLTDGLETLQVSEIESTLSQ